MEEKLKPGKDGKVIEAKNVYAQRSSGVFFLNID
jgi:hypothetical protein